MGSRRRFFLLATARRAPTRSYRNPTSQYLFFSTSSSSSPPNSGGSDGPNTSVDSSHVENLSPTPAPPSLKSPQPLFPWRHETVPLARLVEGTPEHKSLGQMLTSIRKLVPGNARLNSAATSFMFLDVPWYEILWLSHFESDLADNISWAFTQGVAELLWLLPPKPSTASSSMTGTHNHNSNTERGFIDFHQTINLLEAATASVNVVGKTTGEKISTNSGRENLHSSLRSMFQDKLLNYYQSAKDNALASLLSAGSAASDVSGSDQISAANVDSDTTMPEHSKEDIEVRLLMEPYQSELISLYSIPYMSRKLADDDPNYLIFYRNMLSKPSRERTPDLSLLRAEYLDEQGRMESTIIAQVLVWCHEIFYVKHLPSGRILQGQEIMYSGCSQLTDEKDGLEESSASSDNDTSSSSNNNNNNNKSQNYQVRQQIPHLIRMEKTVVTFKDAMTGAYVNSQGDWIITDIDDVLGGNFVV
jgi:hypothetical protein